MATKKTISQNPESEKGLQRLKHDILEMFNTNIDSALCGEDLIAGSAFWEDEHYRDELIAALKNRMRSLPAQMKRRATYFQMITLMWERGSIKAFRKLCKEIKEEIFSDPLHQIRLQRIELDVFELPYTPGLKEEVERNTLGKERLEGEGFAIVKMFILFREGHEPKPVRH